MTETKAPNAILFSPIAAEDKEVLESYLAASGERGCEYAFTNLFSWGEQSYAVTDGCLALFSVFGKRALYPFPIGDGDKKAALEAILADARERGIRCRIIGLTEAEKDFVESIYPGKFRFTYDEGTFDYVYDINDLADLPGKKYHVKRTNLNRFEESFPACSVEPLTRENLPLAEQVADAWYASRDGENDDDFAMEKKALAKAFASFDTLGLEGILLKNGEDVLAFTLASRTRKDTFDVHFEKARADVQGAYAAINRAFACYIREKYPDVRYLNREEDMGLEGLRRAKQSYRPHHMIEKYRAAEVSDAD